MHSFFALRTPCRYSNLIPCIRVLGVKDIILQDRTVLNWVSNDVKRYWHHHMA